MNYINVDVIKNIYDDNSLREADKIIEERGYKHIILNFHAWYKSMESKNRFVKIDCPEELPYPFTIPSSIKPELEKIILASLVTQKDQLEKAVLDYVSSDSLNFSFSEYFKLAETTVYDEEGNFSFSNLVVLTIFSMLTGTKLIFYQYYDCIDNPIFKNGESYLLEKETRFFYLFDNIKNWLCKGYYYYIMRYPQSTHIAIWTKRNLFY